MRPIRLAAFDMDGTLVDTISSWGFVHEHFGENNDIALQQFMNNEIDDEEFVRRDVLLWKKHLKEVRQSDLAEILALVPLMPGAAELMQSLHARGIKTAIVSGGLDHLADRVRAELGMDYSLANGFESDERGIITKARFRVRVKNKEGVLRALQAELGISPEETAAIGNSEIDVGLFRAARIRLAFQPHDDDVRRHATGVVEQKDMRLLIPLILEQA